MNRAYLLTCLIVGICASALMAGATDEPGPLPELGEKVAGFERLDGLMTLHIDRHRGRVFLELPPAEDPDTGHRYLYVEGLVTGLGSNDVGLDRGQIGPARLVGLRRVGGRVLVEEGVNYLVEGGRMIIRLAAIDELETPRPSRPLR